MPYDLKFSFSGHVGSINCLSFSPDGQYLATGSDDRTVFVHDCSSGIEVHKLVGDAPVTSLSWHPKHGMWLFIGYGHGSLVFADLAAHQPVGYKFPVQDDSPIEALSFDVDSEMLAVCHANRVLLWREMNRDYWTYVCSLPSPAGIVDVSAPESPVAPRSCHWSKSGRTASLVVSYAHHGIICWDATASAVIWRISPRNGPTGRSSLAPDGGRLAIHNIADGFDLYEVHPRKRIRTFKYTPTHHVTLPVLFIHGGTALLMGSDAGRVSICDVGTTLPVQVLRHESDVIQAMASFEGETRLIATGSSEMGDHTYVKLWTAPGRPRQSSIVTEPSKRIPSQRIDEGASPAAQDHIAAAPRYISRAVNTSASLKGALEDRRAPSPLPFRFEEPSGNARLRVGRTEKRPNRDKGGVAKGLQARNNEPDGAGTMHDKSVVCGTYFLLVPLYLVIICLACLCLHLYYYEPSGWQVPTIA
ncbi:WD40-repeat-containing domain protein [Fomitopsis serialis]|uniref:WD40-repeat-containing domain protein n=1 Tax=Fomitopsis serialis TaxID=139415 RepID=UPI0020080EFB|nr:WD40-repeat-containing domain protein [Neoantrodia serialis]KAH9923240.1 WD40-repeat-containing domain protein [Neoantrodia serialis]